MGVLDVGNDLLPSGAVPARLVTAAILGAVVGLERETSDQPAGLRTHLTVALGAAVFGVVSTLGFSEFTDGDGSGAVRVDVTRVASQVVVGVGFLGAGVIFRSGSTIRNLTTAASLWVTAAVGLAAGWPRAGGSSAASVWRRGFAQKEETGSWLLVRQGVGRAGARGR